MKKYILLLFLISILPFRIVAENRQNDQDSTRLNFNLDMEQLQEEMKKMEKDLRSMNLADLSPFIDSDQLDAMKEDFKMSFSDMKNNLKSDIEASISKNSSQKDRIPTRTEKKTFSNIAEIEFFHSYGAIIVRESNSNQVDLEIQYFDTKNQQAVSKTNVTNKLLTITSSVSGRSNSRAKINYIISIPKNVTLNIDLKYGDVKMDQFSGPLKANLSYSDFSAQKFTNNSISFNTKYSDLKLEEAKDIDINASYSDFRISKANTLSIIGNYNDYKLGDINHITTKGSTSYGDIKANSIGTMDANLKYADVSIDNLLNSLNVTTAYGDIIINNTSNKLKNINIKASYADVYLTIPQDLSATFDTSLNYGDLNVSKQYEINYTESSERGHRVIKKGNIGTKNPTATIVVTNSYADFKIR